MSDKTEAEQLLEGMMARLEPATVKPADCTHPDFAAACAIARIEDSGTVCLEVRVACTVCHVPMRFKGAPAGWSPEEPTVTIDGLELHAPIEAELEKQLRERARYLMPSVPVKH